MSPRPAPRRPRPRPLSLHRRLDQRRHEGHRRLRVHDPHLAAPAEQLLRANVVAPRHVRHRRTERQALLDGPRLVVARPAPPPAHARQHLQPANLHRPRVKRRVKSRHETIRTKGIVTITGQQRQRKVGSGQRLRSTQSVIRQFAAEPGCLGSEPYGWSASSETAASNVLRGSWSAGSSWRSSQARRVSMLARSYEGLCRNVERLVNSWMRSDISGPTPSPR